MASNSSLLSEDKFCCPICLEVFTQPVSTPCGHNFCMSCITSYWSNAPTCRCPICKETFERKPDLKVNTFISELALEFRSLQLTDVHSCSPDQQQGSRDGGVLCDICTDVQQVAVKSCLECLTSYCDVHLKPHHRAAGLKRHTLVDPLARLEDRICKAHTRLLILFCREDQLLLCDICASLKHADHDVTPVEQAYKEMKAKLGNVEAKVQHLIQERQQKVRATEESAKQSKSETEDVIAKSARELSALVSEIQKSQTELVKVMEEKQKAAAEQADGFISSMEREITELQQMMGKLEELKRTQDRLSFLQSFSNSSVLPHTMDLSTCSFSKPVEIHHMHKSLSKSVSEVRKLLGEMNAEIKEIADGAEASGELTLRQMQRYEVYVELDPDTAHPLLVISEDMRQVRYGMGMQVKHVLRPNMFTEHLAVLGRRGFSKCKFYFEVFVGGKSEWCLGLATASLGRTGTFFRRPFNGLWAIWFLVDEFEDYSSPGVVVWFGKVDRVGVFVDCKGGEISFYDVKTKTLIYSFTDCFFTEELYPYFNPCDNEYGSNLGPMIIVSVNRAE